MTAMEDPPSPRRVNTSHPMPSIVSSRELIEDSSYGTYEHYRKSTEEHSHLDEDDESTCSFWDLLSTIYLPVLFLWLRRSMFGTANLVRSLLLGECLRLLLTYVIPDSSVWEALSSSPWIQPLIGTAAGKADPHAWPPPALTALALLTILAFVVHPDGLTWIMLGKLRDGMVSLLQSIGSCWEIMVHEYGILPTLAASLTLAALVCLIAIIHRTLTPRTPQNSMHLERKKKKRKGHHPKGRTRIRPQPQQSQFHSKPTPSEHDTQDQLEPLQNEENRLQLNPAVAAIVKSESMSSELSQITSDTVGPLPPNSTAGGDIHAVDDQSCGSVSVRSIASYPTSATSGSHSEQSEHVVSSEVLRATTGPGISSTVNRRKQQNTKRGMKTAVDGGDIMEAPQNPSPARPKAMKSSPVSMTHNSEFTASPSSSSGRLAHLRSKRSGPHRGNNSRKGRANHVSESTTTMTTDGNYVNSSSSFFSSPPATQVSGSAHSKHPNSTVASEPSSAGSVQMPPISPSISSHDRFQRAVPHRPANHVVGADFRTSLLSQGYGNVRYNVPNYAGSYAYAQGNGRYSPGKMELAAFLAQVGLVGAACADLLEDLADVDELGALSDAQYELYHVSPEKKAEIGLLLEARCRQRWNCNPRLSPIPTAAAPRWSSGVAVVRPPPGLTPSTAGKQLIDSVGTRSENVALFSSPSRTDKGDCVFSSQQDSSLYSNFQLHGQHPNGASFPAMSSTFNSSYDADAQRSEEEDEENSRIEAELQELGGQMIGSILDF